MTNLIKRPHKRIAYVLQGGGALGSYQVGVIEALQNEGFFPDIISGISIGAINAAIIAGNVREKRIEKLNSFWNMISFNGFWDLFNNDEYSHTLFDKRAVAFRLFNKLPRFLKSRYILHWFFNQHTVDHLGFYDTSGLQKILMDFIDFDLLNSKQVRLYLGAVDVHTGKLIYFNNDEHHIGIEHIMASAAFPPKFPSSKN